MKKIDTFACLKKYMLKINRKFVREIKGFNSEIIEM